MTRHFVGEWEAYWTGGAWSSTSVVFRETGWVILSTGWRVVADRRQAAFDNVLTNICSWSVYDSGHYISVVVYIK